jgi:hypothetical protein
MANTLHLFGLKTARAGLYRLASARAQAAVQRQQVSQRITLDESAMLTIFGLPKALRAGIAGGSTRG